MGRGEKIFQFGFLLPPSYSFLTVRNPRAAHLGSQGAGTFGSVGVGRRVSRPFWVERVEMAAVLQGVLWGLVVAFFFLFELCANALAEGRDGRREGLLHFGGTVEAVVRAPRAFLTPGCQCWVSFCKQKTKLFSEGPLLDCPRPPPPSSDGGHLAPPSP